MVKLEGFAPISSEVKRRLILSIESKEKQGKTNFGLTAPAPLALLNFDTGWEGVVHKFLQQGKEILMSDFTDFVLNMEREKDPAKRNEELWARYKRDYINALRHPDIRTVLTDTATEAWELCRMARFGRLTQVMPFQYGPVNAEFRDLIRQAYNYEKNVIFLHKVKPLYINDKRTSEYERAGFSDMGFLVQANLTLFRDKEGFHCHIRDCRQNAELADLILSGDMCEFKYLAMNVFPDTDEVDWL